jgi:hypothetical protein
VQTLRTARGATFWRVNMTEQPILSAPVWEGDKAPLAKAFIAAQLAMESVRKAAVNTFFSTNEKQARYAELSDVLDAVLPALNAAGVGVIQFPAFDGTMVSITTTLIHEGGSSVTSTLHLRPSKLDPQGVGSAITYGRRYSVLAITGTAPEDDDGNAASGPRQESAPPRAEAKRADPKPPTLAERADRFVATLKGCKTQPDRDKAWKLASGLLADLDAKDPERLAELTTLYEGLVDAPVLEAAE